MTEPRPTSDDQPTVEAPLKAVPGQDARFAPGTLLAGRYRVVYPLGQGGMGEVYRADDLKLGQPVALKFVRQDLGPAARQRLYDEVRLGRQISHPNVCRLYDIVEVEGLTFIAMEYVDGEDLASLLSRIGHLPADKALDIARDLCAGLQAAHDRGVLHRDLKPANVMIDGRGRARLTDFGLAVEQRAMASHDTAGTLLYMSPEQLGGGELTVRSDLYSLGLILYEMVAGRRYFDAGTVDELRSQHRSDRRPRLGVLSGQADSALERVIGQCLDEEPQKRPASARVLLASLPGGDRLEAAIAAGETPAPDVVADASVVGDLRPATAWIVLASAIGGLGLSTWLLAGLSLLPTRPPPKTPEILTERARGILSRLGHDERPVDSAGYFEWDDARFRQIRRTDRAPDRFLRLRNAPLSWLLFVYRQGPEALIAQNRNGVVQRDDPPLDVPGMLEVVLDPQGRLTRYTAIPPEVEAGGPWPEPDWSAFFHEAELDVATFRPVPSEWRSPVDSDRRAAWEGSYPGMPELTVRIEAAAYHGRAVWFALLPPWMAPEARSAPITEDTTEPLTWALVWALIVGLAFGALLLARRNLRLKRGDRKGALRVALFVFAAYSLARLFRADHLAGFWPLITVFAYPLAFAALIWVFYIALEPYARRQWPRILISWGRLLAERWRDPMIGRDVLVGVAAGALGVCLFIVWQHVGTALGQPGWPVGSSPVPEALSSWRNTAYRVFVNLHGATLHSILRLFLLVLLRVLLRRERWALAGWGVLLALTQPLTFEGYSMIRALADAAFVVASVLIDIVVLTRFGLLGLATEYFVGFLLLEVPLTFDASLWWAPRGWVVLTVLTALAVYGFRTSLAGKPAFGRDWLEA